jgi:hypothetical protein
LDVLGKSLPHSIRGTHMKGHRNRLSSHLFSAAFAIVISLFAKPFAGAQQTQSAPTANPAPLRAFSPNELQSEEAASNKARWPAPVARVSTERTPDLKCAVVEWNDGPPKPSLIVVCPPEEVFAPLRLYLKLSWKRDEDVPRDFQAVIAQPNTQTKINWTPRGDYRALLKTERKNGGSGRPEWVDFNDLAGVYIKY